MSNRVLPARVCITVVSEVPHYPIVDSRECYLVLGRLPGLKYIVRFGIRCIVLQVMKILHSLNYYGTP